MNIALKTRQECLQWLREHPKGVKPGQETVIDRFRPEDAEGVARLYHAIYGEGFPIDYVYDPARIVEANRGADLHQLVARTPAGDVVGLSALFRNAPGRGILECGALMLLPEYRLGDLWRRLLDASHALAERELGLNAVFGQSVCDHAMTQKMNRRYGMRGFAFEIEAMPPRPGTNARVSLLDEFKVMRDVPHLVHLPDAYAELLRELYAQAGLKREYGSPGALAERTVGDIRSMDAASLVRLSVSVPGEDLAEAVAGMERDHRARHVCQVALPLSHPGAPLAVDRLRDRGYFLGGLLPLWSDRDALLLQKAAGRPDFSAPVIYHDEANRLVDFVRQDMDQVQGR